MQIQLKPRQFWQNFELTLGPGDEDGPELAVLGPDDGEAGAGEEEEERRHQGGQGQGEGHAAGQPGVHAVTIRLGMATCVKIAPLQFCCGLYITLCSSWHIFCYLEYLIDLLNLPQ